MDVKKRQGLTGNALGQKPHVEHGAYPAEEHSLVGFPSQGKEHQAGCRGCLLNFKEQGHLGKQFAGWPTTSSSASRRTRSGEILRLLPSGVTPHSPSKQNE